MHFMTEDYMTSWINLRISIAMGCSISPKLFIMAVELILDAAYHWTEKHHKPVIIATILIKAFMDDMNIVLTDMKAMQKAIDKVNKLLQWAKMKVKPAKSRSLTLLRGKFNPKVIFIIANNSILTACDGPVKNIGR